MSKMLKGYQCFDILEKLKLVSRAVESFPVSVLSVGDDEIEQVEEAWYAIDEIVRQADIRERNPA